MDRNVRAEESRAEMVLGRGVPEPLSIRVQIFMDCKATKTGVLMKWLVCVSIYMYVLLFGVLNSKLYLLAFFFSYLNYFMVFI